MRCALVALVLIMVPFAPLAFVAVGTEPCWRALANDRANLLCTAVIKLRTNPWP
jgi:hypothetical protein